MGAICSCTSMVPDNKVWQSFKLYYHKSTWWFCTSERGNTEALWDQIFPKKIKSNRDTVGKKDILAMFFEQLAFWNIIHKLSHCAVCAKLLSHVKLIVTPTDSSPFSRQEYWNRLHFLLQGILPTQGSNPGLPRCMWILYWLNYQGSPKQEEGILKRLKKKKKMRAWTSFRVKKKKIVSVQINFGDNCKKLENFWEIMQWVNK